MMKKARISIIEVMFFGHKGANALRTAALNPAVCPLTSTHHSSSRLWPYQEQHRMCFQHKGDRVPATS